MVEISTLYNHLKTLAKQWFYEKSEVDTLLNGKADTTDIPDVSDVIRTSSTAGLVKNDGTIDTSTYLTQHQDISGKANSADLATVATSGSYADLSNIPETFAPSAHEHAAGDVKDSTAHSNLNTAANATQATINAAIDTKIGALLNVDLVQVESTLPSASASTMNKLYLVPESTAETNDAYEIYVTVETTVETTGLLFEDDSSYAWEKIDSTRIDLSGYVTTDDSRLSDARTPTSHTHGNITNDGKVGSDSGKILVTTTGGAVTTSTTIDELDTTVQALITYGSSA